MSNPAVETLLKKREQVVEERRKMNEKFDNEIEQLESAIVLIAEGKVWEVSITETYDDENPDQIRGTEDGI